MKRNKTRQILSPGLDSFKGSCHYLREAAAKAPLVASEKSRVQGKTVVHFACHGKFDAQNSILTHLRLARAERLDLNDILTLPMQNTSLVVLSACETGVNKIGGGDDLIGLTRSFLYAGSSSVIASLWNVDDFATRQLMVSFYRYWRGEIHGTPYNKARALQQAMLDFLQQHKDQGKGSQIFERNNNHPFYWSAFMLIGDWY